MTRDDTPTLKDPTEYCTSLRKRMLEIATKEIESWEATQADRKRHDQPPAKESDLTMLCYMVLRMEEQREADANELAEFEQNDYTAWPDKALEILQRHGLIA